MSDMDVNTFQLKSFESNLNLLVDALNKKHGFLSRVLVITENQEAVLIREADNAVSGASEDNAVLDEMFYQMNDEKQNLIDHILDSDLFFERVFKEISSEFEKLAVLFTPTIAAMQELIRNVTDIDIRIRNQEQKNKSALQGGELRKKTVKADIDYTKASKSYMLKQYEKNSDKKE